MASKTKKPGNENILYIQDIDARVLGIIEGSAQKVYIDNKEVDVVFIDEHEVIPATADERKLYQDANKIVSNYASVYNNEGKASNRSIVGFKNFFAPLKKTEMERTEEKEIKENSFFSKFKTGVSKSHKNLEDDNKEKVDRNLRFLKKDVKFMAKNDAFTREELDIVKNILANKVTKTTPIESNNSSKALTTVKKPQSSITTKSKKK